MTAMSPEAGAAVQATRAIREPELWVQMLALLGLPMELSAFVAASPMLKTLDRRRPPPSAGDV